MKNHKAALLGLRLPFLNIAIFAALVMLSLTSRTIGSAIAVDKIIVLAIVLSPFVYISGAVISIIALFKSPMKLMAIIAAAVNIGMLVFMLYFSTSFLRDFEFIN